MARRAVIWLVGVRIFEDDTKLAVRLPWWARADRVRGRVDAMMERVERKATEAGRPIRAERSDRWVFFFRGRP